MTEKTLTVTLKENAKYSDLYTNSDVDFYVNSSIIASDLNHLEVRTGDVVRAVTHDFDFSSDVLLKMHATADTPKGTTVPAELHITLSPQGGENYNVSCVWKENSSGADETYFNDIITSTGNFKINGVSKQSKTTEIGDNNFGTHAITWNGSDALTFLFELSQTDSQDANMEHSTNTEFKIS